MPNEQPPPADGTANSSILQNQNLSGEVAVTSTTTSQKLPPFWSEQPKLWFIQIESIFQISRVTRDEIKYSHVVANLDPAYLKFVADILVSPPETEKYSTIKDRLINSFSISEEAKLKQLFSGLIIGDQKPTHFLQTMKALAAGNDVSDNVLKTLFLEQLPENIRSILATSNLNLNDLAAQADKIIEIARPQISSLSFPNTVISELTAKIEALDKKFDAANRGRSNFRKYDEKKRRNRSNSKAHSDWCWYHKRFDTNATKCVAPCKHPQAKN